MVDSGWRVRVALLVTAVWLIAGIGSAQRVETQALRTFGLGTLEAIAYSPRGDLIATGGGGGVVLWDARTYEQVRVIRIGTDHVDDVAFTPDGKTLLFDGDREARLWDIVTNREIRSFGGHSYFDMVCVAISPDASMVLTGAGFNAYLWDVDSGELLHTYGLFLGGLEDIEFSPDGRLFVTGASKPAPDYGPGNYNSFDGDLRIWSTETGEEIHSLDGHEGRIPSVDYSPDGTKVLSGSVDDTVRLWNAETGEVIRIWEDIPSWVVAFSPSGDSILCGANWEWPRKYDVNTGALIRTYQDGQYADGTAAVTFSDHGELLLTADNDEKVRIWNASSGTLLQVIEGYTDWVYSVDFDRENTHILTSAKYQPVRMWDLRSGGTIREFGTGIFGQQHVMFAADGSRILGSPDETNQGYSSLWYTSTGNKLPLLLGGSAIGVDSEGTLVLTVEPHYESPTVQDGAVFRFWNPLNGYLYRTLTCLGHKNTITSAALSPDGSLVLTGSRDGTARIWDASTGEERHRFDLSTSEFSGYVFSVAFSPDNTEALIGCDLHGALLMDVESGQQINRYSNWHSGRSVAFHPDGSYVATGTGNGVAQIWKRNTAEPVLLLLGHSNYLNAVDISPDGRSVLTGGQDGLTLLWEIDSPRAVLLAAGDPDPEVNALAEETRGLVGMVYSRLRQRGYEEADIKVLSSFQEPILDGSTPISTEPLTRASLRAVLVGDGDTPAWIDEDAIAGRRVFLYMMDHGYRRGDDTLFGLNACELMSAHDLDAMLDDVQDADREDGLMHDITLFVESCYSGAFATHCAATGEQRRLVMTSSAADEQAIILPDETSFTQHFFNAAYLGASVERAFELSSAFYTLLTSEDGTPVQQPQIADALSRPMKEDRFGRSWIYAAGGGGADFFGDLGEVTLLADGHPVSSGDILDLGTEVTLHVDVNTYGKLEGVFARIMPPSPEVLGGDPVDSLARVDLEPIDEDGLVWEGTYTVDDPGTYAFGIQGRFAGGRVSNTETARISAAKQDWEETRPLGAVLVCGQDDPAEHTGGLDKQALFLTARAYEMTQNRYDGIWRDAVRLVGPSALAGQYGTPLPLESTAASFESAVREISGAHPGTKLFISLIGPRDPSGAFQIAPGETVSAADIDALLGEVQSADPSLDIIVLVDIPYSGAYLETLAGERRYVFTGTSGDGPGFFLPESHQSYASRFLAANERGGTLLNAWRAGRNLMRQYDLPHEPGISDAIGSGRVYLGRRTVFASDVGERRAICSAAPDQGLSGQPARRGQIDLWVDTIIGFEPPERIVAQAVHEYDTGLLISVPTVELVPLGDTNRWTVPIAQIPNLLPRNGTWSVSYTAVYGVDTPGTGAGERSRAAFTAVRFTGAPITSGDANGDGLVTPADAQTVFDCYLFDACADLTGNAGDLCEPESVFTPADAQAVFGIYLDGTHACAH